MSINDINNAAAAMNQLKARYDGFLDDADAQIAQRQAAYDALSANLNGVVFDRMSFEFTWDPDEQNPTNVRGGVYARADIAINQAPAGAYVKIKVPGGKDCHWEYTVPLKPGQNVEFVKADQNAANVIFVSYESGGYTWHRGLIFGIGTGVKFTSVNAVVGEKVNGLGFVSTPGPIKIGIGGTFHAVSSSFSGPQGAALVALSNGTLLNFAVSSVSVDTFALINTFSNCLVIGAKSNFTTLNGGVLQQGGVDGTSVITS